MILKKALRASAVQIISAAILSTFWGMFFEEGSLSLFPSILVVYAPLSAFFNVLLFERDASKSIIMVINVAAVAVFSFFVFFFSTSSMVLYRLICIPFFIAYDAYSLKLAENDVSYGTFIRFFDFSLVMFLVVMIYAEGRAEPVSIINASLLSLISSIVSILVMRHDGDSLAGWASTILSVAIVALLIGLFSGYAGVAGGSLITLWNGIKHAIGIIYSFLAWLFSLLPKAEAEPMGEMFQPSYEFIHEIGGLQGEQTGGGIVFFIVLVILITIALAVFLVFKIRKTRLVFHAAPKRRKKIVSTSLAKGLLRAFSSICSFFRVRKYVFLNRNNSIGLYFWFCIALSRSRWHKRADETPRNFVTRLMALMPEIPIPDISDNIDKVFYGPDDVLPEKVENADKIRASVRKALCLGRFEGILRLRRSKD